jgi:micrococcal nuclease
MEMLAPADHRNILRLCSTILLSLLLLSRTSLAETGTLTARVLWVYDADTIHVAGIGPVRLRGIDAPERQPDHRDRFFLKLGIDSIRLRPMHAVGKEFLEELIKGQEVSLLVEAPARDRYGRLLAYVVMPDGRLANRVLLEKGLAIVYRHFDFQLKMDFLQIERQARRKAVGLWESSVPLDGKTLPIPIDSHP